ncbi:reticulon-like protein B9 isoform X2 [Amborella trichopoda]|uniref:reticulon-like protein B9 isoform X2 n=1 Tax=Amborella trichopoda TaxID=13333 RepID=UPI0009BEDE55|nr:reticulon-like protein B9 isoform X2 [Amborella trichopoda]|eukprot:XP_020530027.1 reticulon-like protein B9 isoform X2 [Amborella trichopoda]
MKLILSFHRSTKPPSHTRTFLCSKPRRAAKEMPISESKDDRLQSETRLVRQHRPAQSIFGKGKVTDVLLWKDWKLSLGVLAGVTAVWLVFEVMEYHFMTVMCYASILAMVLLFVWCNGAAFVDRPPKISELMISEALFKEVAHVLHSKLTYFMVVLQDMASGKDPMLFLLTIFVLWILSVIGSYCNFLSCVYFAYVCMQIMPVLYDRYESEVGNIARTGNIEIQRMYKKFDSNVLNKIPRAKDKKYK